MHRFYRRGEAIARFRGVAFDDEYAPEDWIGSTTTIDGESELGLSTLPDGRLVRRRDPRRRRGVPRAGARGTLRPRPGAAREAAGRRRAAPGARSPGIERSRIGTSASTTERRRRG